MDKEEQDYIVAILATAEKMTNTNQEKLLWVMQGMILAGQEHKND